jgi:hypothetical protein
MLRADRGLEIHVDVGLALAGDGISSARMGRRQEVGAPSALLYLGLSRPGQWMYEPAIWPGRVARNRGSAYFGDDGACARTPAMMASKPRVKYESGDSQSVR